MNHKQAKIRFHLLDKDDRWIGTWYACSEVDAIAQALADGRDAWSAYDSATRGSAGW